MGKSKLDLDRLNRAVKNYESVKATVNELLSKISADQIQQRAPAIPVIPFQGSTPGVAANKNENALNALQKQTNQTKGVEKKPIPTKLKNIE